MGGRTTPSVRWTHRRSGSAGGSARIFDHAELTIQLQLIEVHPLLCDLSVSKTPNRHRGNFIFLASGRHTAKTAVLGPPGGKAHGNFVALSNHPVHGEGQVG